MPRRTLSPRESEVLECLRKGFSTDRIAEELMISVATARNHIQAIMDKLGVSSRVAAVAAADKVHDRAGRLLGAAHNEGVMLTPEQKRIIRDLLAPPCTCAIHTGTPVRHYIRRNKA